MKMIIQIPGVDDLVARINEELPPEIRLWGFVSTNGVQYVSVLIRWYSQSIRVEMNPVVCISLLFVVDKTTRIFVVLHNPATPKIHDAFLIPAAPDDPHSV